MRYQTLDNQTGEIIHESNKGPRARTSRSERRQSKRWSTYHLDEATLITLAIAAAILGLSSMS